MTDLQKHIQSYFSITLEDLKKIEHFFHKTEIKKGDYFLKKEHYCARLSFIKQGYIRIFATINDKEVTQWIATKDYFITDLHSFIFDERARWNMQALTDCTLYSIIKKDYKKLGEIVPNWNSIEKKFITNCFTTLENRIFDHLSLNTEERYRKFFNQNPALFNEVPLQFLASMLGMSPETLSRIRRKINS